MAANRIANDDGAPSEGQDSFLDRVRDAIVHDEISLAYQPQADTHGGQLTGFESLARWRLPDGTVIPPDVFIPMAESSDAIHLLGSWLLQRACETAAGWLKAGLPDLPIAVNVSGRQFDDPGFARTVLGILIDTGLPAANLKLELTETALFTHSVTAREMLTELRGAGVRLVLDDFGTGYSSLALLRRVPVESLKIDKSFVQAMVTDRDAAAIVHAVVELAHALGMTVIAEGVETTEQLHYLRAFRCDRIQGYLLGRPMAAAEVPDFIAQLQRQPPESRIVPPRSVDRPTGQ
ncbi:putative bifunctional diguanylate cyclase/phosphodiesterase [Azospirillum thermophilum]|uniref:EAL domain-containing protein n=1 Tax=Azospirillum thermophilum TaxID=2202148 RepID=A0A2S2CQE6_9PROT|nr:EAL domain-containing protein [Azospirillum thermophilum]AWK86688.1 EAL domain-containing protein [Azospirillum thermophilum]